MAEAISKRRPTPPSDLEAPLISRVMTTSHEFYDKDYVNTKIDCDTVNVVINPSVFDRFFHNDVWYFYDDVLIPYDTLLVDGADRTLSSSQLKKSLSEEDVFNYLWMRFCARLAEAKAEFYRKQKRRFQLLVVLWLTLVALIAFLLSDSSNWLYVLLLAAMNVYPLTVRFVDVTEEQVREIVDEMTPSFLDVGVYIRLWTTSPRMYVEIEKEYLLPLTSSSSLKERMTSLQIQANCDFKETLIARRQEELNGRKPISTKILGVEFTTLLAWRRCIEGFIVVMVMLLIPMIIMQNLYPDVDPYTNLPYL